MTPGARHRQGVFQRDGAKCCMESAACEGRLEAHHIISRQRLRFAREAARTALSSGREVTPERKHLHEQSIEDLIADPRNGVVVCERHHKRPWNIPEPDHVAEFRAEYGFPPTWSQAQRNPPTADLR